jgi:hypothetical protein
MDGYTRLILHGEDDNVADIEGASSYEEGGNNNKDPEHGWKKMHPNMIMRIVKKMCHTRRNHPCWLQWWANLVRVAS